LHLLGPFAPGERRLIKGDMANEVEGVEVASDLFGQFIEKDPLGGEFFDDGLFAFRVLPYDEEIIQ
jgi:hypothetical protein